MVKVEEMEEEEEVKMEEEVVVVEGRGEEGVERRGRRRSLWRKKHKG